MLGWIAGLFISLLFALILLFLPAYVLPALVTFTSVAVLTFIQHYDLSTKFAAVRYAVSTTTFISMLIATLFFYFGQEYALTAALFLLVGMLALVFTIKDGIDARPQIVVNVIDMKTRTLWLPAISGASMLAILAEISGNVIDPPFLRGASHHTQFILLVSGVSLLTWGIAGKRMKTAKQQSHVEDSMSSSAMWSPTRWKPVLPIFMILLLALLVRNWRLEQGMHLFVDEVHFAQPVTHFYAAGDVELLLPFSSVAAFPYVYPYLQWQAVQLIGRNLAGLRAVSVVFGVLTVWSLYLLAYELFDRKTALLAAALLAVYPVHIQYSRLGLNNIADPFFGTMAFYFLARGLNKPHAMRFNFACAGGMLGLTQYFYEGGRFLYPALALSWLFLLLIVTYFELSIELLETRRKGTLAGSEALRKINSINFSNVFKSALALATTMIISGAPVYYTLAARGTSIALRMETAGIQDRTTEHLDNGMSFAGHIAWRLYESFIIHVSIPEWQLYYGGKTAFILAFLVPFFFVGVVYSLYQMISPRRFQATSLILMWLAATWLGNSLLQESRISARYVVEFPALMIVIALGMICTADTLFPKDRQKQKRLLAVMISAVMVLQVNYFFNIHLPVLNDQFRNDKRDLDTDDALFRSVDFPPETRVIIVGELVMNQVDARKLMRFMNPEILVTTMHYDDLMGVFLRDLDLNYDHAFFIDPDHSVVLKLLKIYFPDIQGPQYSSFDLPEDKQFMLYYAAARK